MSIVDILWFEHNNRTIVVECTWWKLYQKTRHVNKLNIYEVFLYNNYQIHKVLSASRSNMAKTLTLLLNLQKLFKIYLPKINRCYKWTHAMSSIGILVYDFYLVKIFKRCTFVSNKSFILNSWNVIFIWKTGYWTWAIKRFALFDLLKSLYSDTKILSKYFPSLQRRW